MPHDVTPTDRVAPRTTYSELTREELEQRLSIAEDVCLMFGWSAYHDETDRDVATYRLWNRWTDAVGPAFLKPRNHPHLSDEAAKELAESAGYTRWEHTFVGEAHRGD